MIEVKNLMRTFKDGDRETRVLKDVNFSAAAGEFVAIMGRSGAGKSTFMYQMSLLDEPTSGEIRINGVDTPVAVSLTAAETAAVTNTTSAGSTVAFDLSVKQVCAASSTTSDVVVVVGLY